VVEQKFDELLREPGRAIVVAAGNSFNQRSHLNRVVIGKRTEEILWHTDRRSIAPDTTRNEMEIWYPGNRELLVSVFTPEGSPLGAVALGKAKALYDSAGKLCGRIDHRANDPNNNDNQIDLQLPHLEGAWRIQLSNVSTEETPFHAWIEQDDSGQSRFEEPTDPFFTLGSISNSRKTISVGAFDTSEMASLAPPFAATSAGPTRPSRRGTVKPREKPELSAPGVGIIAARAHGGVTVMDGTSMAAGHVTGVIALLFDLAQRRGDDPLPIDLTREILIGAATTSSSRDSIVEDLGQRRRLGFGRIDAAETLRALLESEVYHQEEPELERGTPHSGLHAPDPNLEDRLEKMMARHFDELEKKMSKKLDTMVPKTPRPTTTSRFPRHLLRDQGKAQSAEQGYGPSGQGNGTKRTQKAPRASRPKK
jgi:subtilisin family serine protease